MLKNEMPKLDTPPSHCTITHYYPIANDTDAYITPI